MELYKSRKNLLTYLKRQNFDTDAHETFTMNEIQAMFESQTDDGMSSLDFEVVNKSNSNKKVSVFYYMKPSSIKQNTLEEMVMNFYEENNKEDTTFILLMQGSLNETVQKSIINLWKKFKEYVIVFEIRSLQFSVFDHNYVPDHTKMTMQEKEDLYKAKNISSDEQMPEISVFDPVAKALLMKPGELCRIKRFDKIAFETVFYRLCVI
jgi:DNA-directed RNA polymerase subunit H (RpoH/RPB5)